MWYEATQAVNENILGERRLGNLHVYFQQPRLLSWSIGSHWGAYLLSEARGDDGEQRRGNGLAKAHRLPLEEFCGTEYLSLGSGFV